MEVQRVTAIDLLLELSRPGKPGQAIEPPADLAAEELTLLWDGEPLEVLTLAPGGADEEPWRLVIYVDRVLSSSHTIRWAAMELAERAERLTELGEVEIVVAEPEPRRALAASRDAALVDDTLSGIFLEPAAAAELVLVRERFLVDRGADETDADELARAAAETERRLLGRQMDRLLDFLVETAPPTSRRAVLLVGDGWDLRPEEFYDLDNEAPAGPELADATAELAETLAAYSWVTAPMAPPAPAVGAGRFGAYVVTDFTFPWLFAVKLRSLEVWLDGNRKPKKADALAKLAHSLRDQGRLADAVEAYRKSIYHYYDHPKTASRQAAALVALGETLELQGKPSEARAAFRTATIFEPALQPRFPFAAAALDDPLTPLEQIARLTAGTVVADPESLDTLLTSLGRRLRLTAQLGGVPDGALHRLEVRLRRDGLVERSPTVARWGTPPAITRLRLRRLLEGELTAGGLEVDASPVRASTAGEGRLEIALDVATLDERGDLLVSWASTDTRTAPRFRVRAATIAADRARTTIEVELPGDPAWLAFLVEDPATGAWGGGALESSGG